MHALIFLFYLFVFSIWNHLIFIIIHAVGYDVATDDR